MPIDYKKYPPNWKSEIRPRILKRAGNCCEFCGVPNYTVMQHVNGIRYFGGGNEYWDKAGRGELSYKEARELVKHHKECCPEDDPWIVIVLTIAHLDHDEHNHNIKDSRLASLCQRCHLEYDAPEKAKRRREKKFKNQYKLNRTVLVLYHR